MKISVNLCNFLHFEQFFSNFLEFQWANFEHFKSTMRTSLLNTQVYNCDTGTFGMQTPIKNCSRPWWTV